MLLLLLLLARLLVICVCVGEKDGVRWIQCEKESERERRYECERFEGLEKLCKGLTGLAKRRGRGLYRIRVVGME